MDGFWEWFAGGFPSIVAVVSKGGAVETVKSLIRTDGSDSWHCWADDGREAGLLSDRMVCDRGMNPSMAFCRGRNASSSFAVSVCSFSDSRTVNS